MTNHENHIALWTWLSENPGKEKEDYFGSFEWKQRNPGKTNSDYLEEEHPDNDCYACKEATQRAFQAGVDINNENFSYDGFCVYCPLTWDTEHGNPKSKCIHPKTTYQKWDKIMENIYVDGVISPEEEQMLSKLAKEIAEMNWK